MGLVDLLAEESNSEDLKRLKKTAQKLDERIHEINSMMAAIDNEFESFSNQRIIMDSLNFFNPQCLSRNE